MPLPQMKVLLGYAATGWHLVWKYLLIFTIAMAVSLVAITANVGYLIYLKAVEHCSTSIRRFFNRFIAEELEGRFVALEGQFDVVAGELRSLKKTLDEQMEMQKTKQEEICERLEALRSMMAANKELLESMAQRDLGGGGFSDASGPEEAFQGRRRSFGMVFPSTSGSGDVDILPMTPPSSEAAMSPGVPNNSPVMNDVLLMSPDSAPPSDHHYHSVLSTPLSSSNALTSSPIPPPPPMPNFGFTNKTAFKISPRTASVHSSGGSASGTTTTKQPRLAISLSEINEMRKKLKKVSENGENVSSDKENATTPTGPVNRVIRSHTSGTNSGV